MTEKTFAETFQWLGTFFQFSNVPKDLGFLFLVRKDQKFACKNAVNMFYGRYSLKTLLRFHIYFLERQKVCHSYIHNVQIHLSQLLNMLFPFCFLIAMHKIRDYLSQPSVRMRSTLSSHFSLPMIVERRARLVQGNRGAR